MKVQETTPPPAPTPPRTFTLEIDEQEATMIKALVGRVGAHEEHAILGVTPQGSGVAGRMYRALETAGIKHKPFQIDVVARPLR